MRSSHDESAKIMVLPDSGTRELEGLCGELTIAIGADGAHTYSFEYELSET